MPKIADEHAIDIGYRLRKRRNEFGWRQGYVAEKLDVSTSHYSCIERGEKSPSTNLMVRMMDLYKLSADYILLGRLDNETTNDIIEEINSLPDDKRREFYSVIRTLLKIAK